ncbi:hypothetical protein [Lactococcus lactis]|uniref:hypothetical protein n=1 Tax=Lactococcus lactis TaxID=1358 RepID=UPI0018C6C0DF|nr:hypothetical protein [Lactococcus lactis]MBG1279283.1 hypothetical protein [Lactococcus lactis subsp. lactis]
MCWKDKYRCYLSKEGLSDDYSKFLSKLIDEDVEKDKNKFEKFNTFMENHCDYSWSRNENSKSDQEHAISYLISLLLSGNQEKNFYKEIVGINLEGKINKKGFKIEYRSGKSNIGMILWLAVALEVAVCWKKLDEESTIEKSFIQKLVSEINGKLEEIGVNRVIKER